jgi:photosystem II stability/assembly factor-like uncharacterized protein/RNA polymerase subunit RPABC4/transcription elongation factor Spt4
MIHGPTERSTGARCSQCGEVIGPEDRFCPICGAAQPVTCPSCGAVAEGSLRRCPECGGPLPTVRPLLNDAAPSGHDPIWKSRGFRLLIGAAACLVTVFAAVAYIYFTSPDRQKDQPVSHVSAQTPDSLAIRPGAPPLVLIGTPSGLLVSEDQGSSWQQFLMEGGVKAIGVASSDSSPMYLGGSHLWRSAAAGFREVATNLPAGGVQALAVDSVDPNRVYAVVVGRGLYRSDDAGQHWTALSADVPANITALAVVGGKQPLLFVATSQRGIFASGDGRSWANANGFVNGALPTQVVEALAYDPHSGDSYVAPNGATMSGALYAGTDLGLFKSIDGGQSWSPLPFHHPIAALGVSPSGHRLMLVVDLNGNVYRSRDGGVTWR